MPRPFRGSLVAAVVLASLGYWVAPAGATEPEPPKPACGAKLNYIHKSTSAGTAGRVKVYGDTVCNLPMEVISVEVLLYQEVGAQKVLIGTSPDPIATGRASIGRSAVGGTCTPGYYYAESTHFAKFGPYTFTKSIESGRQFVSCA